VVGVFVLGFLDKLLHPALLITVPVVPEALIDPEHFSEEFAFGAVFFLGNLCDLLSHSGRDRKPHDFGSTSHLTSSSEFNQVQPATEYRDHRELGQALGRVPNERIWWEEEARRS
jgi:hypothetical protein